MTKQMTIRNHATTKRPSVTLSGLLVSRTPKASARPRARELPFPQYDLPVHHHVLDPHRRLVRPFKGRAIDHGRRIEDGDVRVHPGPHQTAVGEADALSGQ